MSLIIFLATRTLIRDADSDADNDDDYVRRCCSSRSVTVPLMALFDSLLHFDPSLLSS